MEAGLRGAFYLMGWFLVDKLGGGGLDDWEVKIADIVVLLGKDAKMVADSEKRAKGVWKIRLRCPKIPDNFNSCGM